MSIPNPTPTPTKDVANAASLAEKEAITTLANNSFITNANLQIANAQALGKFYIQCEKLPHIHYQTLIDYFQGLGYSIFIPYFAVGNPAQLVGEFWEQYWEFPNVLSAISRKNDLITISWQTNPHLPLFYPSEDLV